MKALTILAVITMAAHLARADSGAVDANNWEGNNAQGNPIYYLSGGTLAPVGQNIYVQILAGPLSGSLAPVLDVSGNEFIIPMGAPSLGAGYFDGAQAFVPGVAPGSQAQFEIEVWQGTSGFDSAKYRVTSPIWTQQTGPWGPIPRPGLPPPPPLWPPWSSLTIVPVPEPSTLALALLGGVVGLRQRRSRRVPNWIQLVECDHPE